MGFFELEFLFIIIWIESSENLCRELDEKLRLKIGRGEEESSEIVFGGDCRGNWKENN